MAAAKKKLLIATDCFIPRWDGIARFLTEVIPAIKDDYDITVIAPAFKGTAPDIPGITTIRIPLGNLRVGDFQVSKTQLSVLRKHIKETDIVWTHTLASIGGNAIRIAHHYRKPTVAYIHSIEWELVSKSMASYNFFRKPARVLVEFFARWLYNKCTHLMVPSEEVKELAYYKGIRTPSTVVYLGTDISRFSPPANKAEAKVKIGLAPDQFVIGYVGRLAREKDLITLYRAYMRLRKDNNNLRLLIVGGGVEEVENYLRAKPGILVAGPQDNVVPYYQAMDVYVLPSLTETTSLTTLEAMSCEVVPVCTPVGNIKRYIREKENGMLFPKKNSLVLALKLEWLIKNPSVRTLLAKEARQTVVDNFSWEHTTLKVKEVLSQL